MRRPSDVMTFYNLKERQRRLWAEDFAAAAYKITYAGDLWKVDRDVYEWNPLLFTKGVLIVNIKEQVILRYWCNTDPELRSMEDVLYKALERGVQFIIAIREDDRSSFRKPEVKITELDRDAKKQYSADYRVPPLVWQTGPAFQDDYLGHIVDILRRAHAGCFLFMGGPVVRITREFGGHKVLKKAMKGPSIQTTMHSSGGTDSDDKNVQYLIYDTPSNAEVDFLLGRVPGNGPEQDLSLFPTLEMLEKGCANWTGEWTPQRDSVFTRITADLRASTPSLRSRREWIKFLRPPTFVAPEAKVSNKDWLEARDMLFEVFGVDWNKKSIADISVPETFNPTSGLESLLTAELDQHHLASTKA